MAAAEQFDAGRLIELFGPDGEDIVLTGEYAQDRQRATDFAAKAREKMSVSLDPKSRNRAFLIVGNEDWPFPIPIVKRGGAWSFDAAAGKQELRARRIGSNELDAIQIARGYVEAQHEHALRPRQGYEVNHMRNISSALRHRTASPGRHPTAVGRDQSVKRSLVRFNRATVGRAVPRLLLQDPKGQGLRRRWGRWTMSGRRHDRGFALVAAPARCGATGIKTFMVSQDGVVYEKISGRPRWPSSRRWSASIRIALDPCHRRVTVFGGSKKDPPYIRLHRRVQRTRLTYGPTSAGPKEPPHPDEQHNFVRRRDGPAGIRSRSWSGGSLWPGR